MLPLIIKKPESPKFAATKFFLLITLMQHVALPLFFEFWYALDIIYTGSSSAYAYTSSNEL